MLQSCQLNVEVIMVAELPNTDDPTVMRMAIAWEMVLRANPTASGHKPEDTLKN